MVVIGAHCEGFLSYPIKKLDTGLVVPDVSLSEIHSHQKELILDQIELAVFAEETGFDYVTHPENHLSPMAKNSPTPIQTQVAIAENTDKIRLLQMANVLPWHNAVQLAERLSMLDIVSEGRAEVGLATGMGDREIGIFSQISEGGDVEKEELETAFQERYEVLIKAWTKDSFNYKGDKVILPPSGIGWQNEQEYYYLKDKISKAKPSDFLDIEQGDPVLSSVSVFPQPEQEPYPQIWRAMSSEKIARWAGKHGANGCTISATYEDAKTLIEAFYESAEDAGWPDRREKYDGNPFKYGWDQERGRGVAVQVPLFNEEVASQRELKEWKLGNECLLSFIRSAAPEEAAKGISLDLDERLKEHDFPIIGTTDEIIQEITKFREICRYDDFIIFPIVGVPGMSLEQKKTQLRVFAQEVAPHLS